MTLNECAAAGNVWAQRFLQMKQAEAGTRAKAQAKAAATRAYLKQKPEAILELEKQMAIRCGSRVTYDDRTANGLTAFILDWLQIRGHYAARINTGGTAIGAKAAGGREAIKWATSGSTKGVADVVACIRGKFCQFEVKAGKDRPRQDQLKQQELTRKAGGVYEFIHSATEFDKIAQELEQL